MQVQSVVPEGFTPHVVPDVEPDLYAADDGLSPITDMPRGDPDQPTVVTIMMLDAMTPDGPGVEVEARSTHPDRDGSTSNIICAYFALHFDQIAKAALAWALRTAQAEAGVNGISFVTPEVADVTATASRIILEH